MSRPPMPRYTKQPDKQAFYIKRAMQIKSENPNMSLGEVFDQAYDYTEENYVPRWKRESLAKKERELQQKEKKLAAQKKKSIQTKNYSYINRMLGLCVECGSITSECICEE